ncbi:MAG: bifunctional 2-polyprenyl-6-hydroxyphenol methylase/3-demethylubiquinol 3-O-methyltransferase UbiG, partial [Pseudomonadota bacterium]
MARAQSTTTLDPAEVERFDEISAHWWDPKGQFRPLHSMNPVRVGYIRDRVVQHRADDLGSDPMSAKPLEGLALADIGCGGGLLSEPMARMGASVIGVDASERAIAVASDHAGRQGLSIEYRCSTAEDLAAEQPERFDVVTCLEIVEHVADVDAFTSAVAAMLKPGGIAIFSTLNRTAKSFAVAIAGAEYLLRLLPRGTHDWQRFL